MKKIILAVSLVAVVALAFGVVSYVSAQGTVPPAGQGFGQGMMGGMMGRGGWNNSGPMHEYMVSAIASRLDMSAEDLQAELDSGKSMWQVAQEKGFSDEQIQTLMQEAHVEALDAAVAAGAITQAQAEQMKSRHATMLQNGMVPGACHGQGGGRGMMGAGGMMRGRWNNGTNY